MSPHESIMKVLHEKRNSMRASIEKFLPNILMCHNLLNRDALDTDLPRFILDRKFQFFHHLVRGVYGWELFVLVMRAHKCTMVKMNTFLYWAQDVQSYPNPLTDHRQRSLRGSIFSTKDSDIFLAFAHMTAPVYLACSEIPRSNPPLSKPSFSPWRNKVGIESLASHDDWQKLDRIFHPHRLAHGLAFKREARGVAIRTDPAAPTPQLANRLRNIQRMETNLQDRKICAANRAKKPPKDNTIMQLLNQPSDYKAFNSSLASLAKKPLLLDWFPKPHPTHTELEIYVLKKNLKDKKTSQTYWFPPYEIFLTGDNPETAKIRWKFLLMFRPHIFNRHLLSLHDPAVRPLTKRQWRNISSGAEFRSRWPQGESFPPFDPSRYWRAGLDEMFGTVAPARAKEGVCSLEDFESEIAPSLLSCGCDVSTIDWETDTELKTLLAITSAEMALLHEFVLIDRE
ncbi:uncharacterized protein STEHIDRAFT_162944 [Stereum hirsutum FP-91666 SS1]|uniref:Uncharacterized protein n=1 Tax=Stereum hirsutum (strain FP-91666) TaxID=721885 RepID=R7S0I8_STEHR|nr:uncharacterized protein STEHIDRAFT_162944 [Stereum hirsutum FP-91666 SS1]EIM80057.1 hypothetical protein STEHIDRAFT_162944 [Stereum hirsutum FP-91666 SS1]